MIGSFFSALLVFMVSSLVHMVLCRIFGTPRFMFRSLLQGVLTVPLFAYFQLNNGGLDIVALYIFFALWIAYLACFINLFNSVTLKMLEVIANSPEEKLHVDGFDSHFTEEDSVDSRIKSMELNGFLTVDGQKVALTSKGNNFVNIILFLRAIFSIKEVG